MKSLLYKILATLPFGIEEVPAEEETPEPRRKFLSLSTPAGTMAYYGQYLPLSPPEARATMYKTFVLMVGAGAAILYPLISYIDYIYGR